MSVKSTEVAVRDRAIEALNVVDSHPGVTAGELAQRVGIARSTATARLATLQRTGWVKRQPGGTEAGRRLPDRFTMSRRGSGVLQAKGVTPQDGRLDRGELSRLVLAELVANGGPTSPVAIARALDRSAGAVANALDRLTVRGDAELVQSAPRRYRSTSAGRAASRWEEGPKVSRETGAQVRIP